MGDKIESEEGGRGRQGLDRSRSSRRDRGDEAGREDRRRDRLSRDDQGLRRRRRQGHAHRPFDGGSAPRSSPCAKAEAKSSFGDDRVFIEKFIVDPRHIEIQVLGDKHGNVIYLGERECSIQRRNQKVIEEAPSPLLDETTRRKPWASRRSRSPTPSTTRPARSNSSSTQDRNFYFLEMNTRLQVEHPVTELVTGIDLVEQMIRVAAGEKLTIAQKDVTLKGWAVELRVYAEDPFRNFLPSIGRLVKYRPPAERETAGITVRNDTGVQEGGEIPIYYDPMIAKLVTHAPSRAAAIEAQSMALDAFYVDGIRHNIPFLSALMNHPRWREGKLSTGFIAEEFPRGFSARTPEGEVGRRLAAVAAAIDHVLGERKRQISGQLIGAAGAARKPSRGVARSRGNSARNRP